MQILTKFIIKAKNLIVNVFIDWFDNRCEIIINFYLMLKENIIKLNTLRKKKYSSKHIRYFVELKLYLIPKRDLQKFIRRIYREYRYLRFWSFIHTDDTGFVKHLRKKLRRKYRGKDKLKAEKQFQKDAFIEKEVYNFWYSNYFYYIIIFFTLLFLLLSTTFIIYAICTNKEVFY